MELSRCENGIVHYRSYICILKYRVFTVPVNVKLQIRQNLGRDIVTFSMRHVFSVFKIIIQNRSLVGM